MCQRTIDDCLPESRALKETGVGRHTVKDYMVSGMSDLSRCARYTNA